MLIARGVARLRRVLPRRIRALGLDALGCDLSYAMAVVTAALASGLICVWHHGHF